MSKFYGFETEEQARRFASRAGVEEVFSVSLPRVEVFREATRRSSRCVGSAGGVFHYADGHTDTGQPRLLYYVEIAGMTIAWGEQASENDASCAGCKRRNG